MRLEVKLNWDGFCMGCPAAQESSSGYFCFYDYYNEADKRCPEYYYPNKDWKWQEIKRPQKCIEDNGN